MILYPAKSRRKQIPKFWRAKMEISSERGRSYGGAPIRYKKLNQFRQPPGAVLKPSLKAAIECAKYSLTAEWNSHYNWFVLIDWRTKFCIRDWLHAVGFESDFELIVCLGIRQIDSRCAHCTSGRSSSCPGG
jgi:hypothetical protein